MPSKLLLSLAIIMFIIFVILIIALTKFLWASLIFHFFLSYQIVYSLQFPKFLCICPLESIKLHEFNQSN